MDLNYFCGQFFCCIIGIEDFVVCQEIVNLIEVNGGCYIGDFVKDVMYLIVQKFEGKKYYVFKRWG